MDIDIARSSVRHRIVFLVCSSSVVGPSPVYVQPCYSGYSGRSDSTCYSGYSGRSDSTCYSGNSCVPYYSSCTSHTSCTLSCHL